MHKHHRKHAPLAQSDPTGPKTQTAIAPGAKDRNSQLLSAENIRLRAYRKWEGAGRPAGDGVQFWLEAEQELKQGK